MKKYFSRIIITILFIAAIPHVQAQSAKDKVAAIIAVFPYQHHSETDAALAAMGAWDKHEWKSFIKMLDDDSMKVKASYALNAYVNTASQDEDKKNRLRALLKKYLPSSKTEYAKILIQSQLNLLTDKSIIDKANNSLPKLPETKTAAPSTSNNEQKLLLLEDRMAAVKNPIEKRNILSQVAHIQGFSSFMLVSKSLKDADVDNDAALALARLALTDENIRGPVVRAALETALPLIKGEDSAVLVSNLQTLLRKMPYDYGFVSLFNGTDLTGWKALVGNPITRSKMSAYALDSAEKIANEKTKNDWIVKDGWLIFTGHGDNLAGKSLKKVMPAFT
jgi:hypothetical protein